MNRRPDRRPNRPTDEESSWSVTTVAVVFAFLVTLGFWAAAVDRFLSTGLSVEEILDGLHQTPGAGESWNWVGSDVVHLGAAILASGLALVGGMATGDSVRRGRVYFDRQLIGGAVFVTLSAFATLAVLAWQAVRTLPRFFEVIAFVVGEERGLAMWYGLTLAVVALGAVTLQHLENTRSTSC